MQWLLTVNQFFEKSHTLNGSKREDKSFCFSPDRYSKIIFEVMSAKNKCSTLLGYWRLKCFDILKVSDEQKLIVPLKPGETNIQYYVTKWRFVWYISRNSHNNGSWRMNNEHECLTNCKLNTKILLTKL